MLEYLYLFCIVATISVFLATPLGFTPGTDLHVARVYQADSTSRSSGNSPTKFVMDRSSRTLGSTNSGNSGRRWKR